MRVASNHIGAHLSRASAGGASSRHVTLLGEVAN